MLFWCYNNIKKWKVLQTARGFSSHGRTFLRIFLTRCGSGGGRISNAILNARWLRNAVRNFLSTVHYDFRGTMRLYGRFLPPRSYPLVVPYVTSDLMVCLEVDIPCTINVRRRDFAFLLYATCALRHVSLFSRNYLPSYQRHVRRAATRTCRRDNTCCICFR